MNRPLFQQLFCIIKRLILLLTIYSITRLIFYLFNLPYLSFLPGPIRWQSFLYGLGIDVSTLLRINFIFIILWLIPYKFSNTLGFTRSVKFFYISINSLFLLLNFIDIGLYRYTGYRSNLNILNSYLAVIMESPGFLLRYILDYWHLLIIYGLIVVILIRFYFKIPNTTWTINNKTSLIAAAVIFMAAIGIRGINDKPLSVNVIARRFQFEFNPLVLNTPFVIIDRILNPPHQIASVKLKNKSVEPAYHKGDNSLMNKKNVVILIVEGLSREYVGLLNKNKGYTPNLDSLFQKGMLCSRAFANGRTTLNALPAILCSEPAMSDFPYILEGNFSDNFFSIAELLKNLGYSTHFFYGSNNGNLGIENFAKKIGFVNYYGLNQYPDKSDFDGYWGIFDDKFLGFSVDMMDTLKEPFLSCILTLSSHHPFRVPENFKLQNTSRLNKHQISILYSDYALSEFFKKASKTSWYKNTLFIVTADHTSEAFNPEYRSQLGMYAIPIWFFQPSDSTLNGFNNKITEQIDLFPSIMDYLNINRRYIYWGESVFDATNSGKFVFYSGNNIYLLKSNLLVRYRDSAEWDYAKVNYDSLFNTPDFIKIRNDSASIIKMKLDEYLNYNPN